MTFLTQFFTGPEQPGISRPWMIAKYFGSKGHQIDVICSRGDYVTGTTLAQKDNSEKNEPISTGVTVHRVATILWGKFFLARGLQYLSFAFFAFMKGLTLKGTDVVLATSPPIFVGVIGVILAKVKRAQFIFEVRDPWPDALIYFGVLKKSYFTRLLYWLEMYIYQNADLIVALTPGIKKLIEKKGIAADKIIVITNGYDDEFFQLNGKLIYPRKTAQGAPTKVIYVGSLGKINETEYLMDTVTLFKDFPDLIFEFIGGGICKEQMMATARERNLNNVAFLPPVPKDKVPQILSTGDIAIVFTKPGLYSEIGLHNKIFDYMGAGIPVIATGGGDLQDLIERSGAGYILTPRDIEGVASKIRELHLNKDLAWEMGEKGRGYVFNHYRRDLLVAAYEARLSQLVSKRQFQHN